MPKNEKSAGSSNLLQIQHLRKGINKAQTLLGAGGAMFLGSLALGWESYPMQLCGCFGTSLMSFSALHWYRLQRKLPPAPAMVTESSQSTCSSTSVPIFIPNKARFKQYNSHRIKKEKGCTTRIMGKLKNLCPGKKESKHSLETKVSISLEEKSDSNDSEHEQAISQTPLVYTTSVHQGKIKKKKKAKAKAKATEVALSPPPTHETIPSLPPSDSTSFSLFSEEHKKDDGLSIKELQQIIIALKIELDELKKSPQRVSASPAILRSGSSKKEVEKKEKIPNLPRRPRNGGLLFDGEKFAMTQTIQYLQREVSALRLAIKEAGYYVISCPR